MTLGVPKRRILRAAVKAAGRATGIVAHVRPGDAVVQFELDRRKHRFRAEVKTVDRFETPAMVKARGKAIRQPLLLVAPYITREVAERCRRLGLAFIDTAGNAYLKARGLLVYVAGQPRPAALRQDKYRALNAAGLKLTFALLCRPALLNENYRKIAESAGVALGTVGPAMKDLEKRGFFNLGTHPSRRKLLDAERMLEEWVTHYPVTLRPKLGLGRFQAEPEYLLRADLTRQGAFWGGEPGAEKLTQYLKPAQFTIYAKEPLKNLIAAGRMRAAENGNVEILDKFWNFEESGDRQLPDVAPPILVYADLLATHDGRNAEAARMIYEQRIVPALGRG